MNKYFDQLGEKLRINYHIIEIIIFGDTVRTERLLKRIVYKQTVE